jgi:uncharacterized protein YmfQ (DUF2313 family)
VKISLGGSIDTALHILGKQLDKADESATFLLRAVLLDSELVSAEPDIAEVVISGWERDLGLSPSIATSLADRRTSVIGKLRASGGLSRSFFENIAEGLGFNIGTHAEAGDPHLRINEGEFLPFRAGYSESGDMVWDQGTGHSWATCLVIGTSVEDTDLLVSIFTDLCPPWAEFIFVNE